MQEIAEAVSIGLQHFFKHLSLSIVILSLVVGRSFYLNPHLLIVCLPIALALTYYTIKTRQAESQMHTDALNLPQSNKIDNPSKNWSVNLEMVLYLFSAFITDILALLNISQTAFILLLPPGALTNQFIAFLFSMSLAVYIHAHHRLPEYLSYYDNVKEIREHLQLKRVDFTPLYKSIGIYAGLIASAALFELAPLVGTILGILTVTASLYNFRAFLDTNIALYISFALNVSILSFTSKAVTILRRMHMFVPPLKIISACSYAVAFSHLSVHYLGKQRETSIQERLNVHVKTTSTSHP